MPLGFGEGEGERMPRRFDEEGAFAPDYARFAGGADLRGGPFFDLLTLAA